MDLYSDWKEYSINLITDVHRLWSVRNKTCNASDCVLYFDILTFFINLGITSLHTTPQKNVTKKMASTNQYQNSVSDIILTYQIRYKSSEYLPHFAKKPIVSVSDAHLWD